MRLTGTMARVGASAKAVAVETPYALIANVPGPVGAEFWTGDDCGIAGGSSIYSVSHHYQDESGHGRSYVLTSMAPAEQQYLISAPCVVEDGAALGTQSVMLPGSTVKRGSWVGVHSLVLGEIGPDVVATGNPAEPVKPIQR